MGKLHHNCVNNQKTGDLEWELVPSALESMVTIERDRASEFTSFETSLQCPGMGITPSVSQFLANIYISS